MSCLLLADTLNIPRPLIRIPAWQTVGSLAPSNLDRDVRATKEVEVNWLRGRPGMISVAKFRPLYRQWLEMGGLTSEDLKRDVTGYLVCRRRDAKGNGPLILLW